MQCKIRLFPLFLALPLLNCGGETLIEIDGGGNGKSLPEVCVRPNPSSLNFGCVEEGSSETSTIGITNECEEEVYLRSVSWERGCAGDVFTLASYELPAALGKGEEFEMTVTYTPADEEPVDCKLLVEGEMEEPFTLIYTVRGNDPEGISHTDTFFQTGGGSADILFVMDNSGTMWEEQVALSNLSETFVGGLNDRGVDFQIGVVTTDMRDPNQSGRLQGSPLIVTPSTPDPTTALAQNLQVGINGSYVEMGLAAAYYALTEPLMTGYNAGFLREEAHLAIVAVSDEPDQSTSIDYTFFVEWLDSLRGAGNEDKTSLSALVGLNINTLQPSACSSPNGDAYPGSGYYEVAVNTEGALESICTLDFTDFLLAVLNLLPALVNEFPLSHFPVVDSMEVEVEGETVEYGYENGWTYSEENNSVHFHGEAVPDPYETILVIYDVSEC